MFLALYKGRHSQGFSPPAGGWIPLKILHVAPQTRLFENWADRNKLKLNRKKSCEIVFLVQPSNSNSATRCWWLWQGATYNSLRCKVVSWFLYVWTHRHCHNKLCTHSLRSPNTTSSWYASSLTAANLPDNRPRQTTLCHSRLVGLSKFWWNK